VRLPIYIDAPGADADPNFTRPAVFHLEFGWKTNPYYPMQAYLQNASGQVMLQCVLARSGVLSDCVSLQETPMGLHFADAALKMAERQAITAKPAAGASEPPGGEVVRVWVPFNL
jgi:Gram-negative bacterial TonB protein C-terminal